MELSDLIAHRLQLRFGPELHLFARRAGFLSKEIELGDLLQCEPQLLRVADESNLVDSPHIVESVPRLPSLRLADQTFALIESDGRDAHTSHSGNLTDQQRPHSFPPLFRLRLTRAQ